MGITAINRTHKQHGSTVRGSSATNDGGLPVTPSSSMRTESVPDPESLTLRDRLILPALRVSGATNQCRGNGRTS
jgi:hypothetical protein